MLLKIRKKTIWNLHFPSIMYIVFSSFKHPELPISIKFLSLWCKLHDTRFDFQQCGILTSVDSDEQVQPPVKLRNSRAVRAVKESIVFKGIVTYM